MGASAKLHGSKRILGMQHRPLLNMDSRRNRRHNRSTTKWRKCNIRLRWNCNIYHNSSRGRLIRTYKTQKIVCKNHANLPFSFFSCLKFLQLIAKVLLLQIRRRHFRFEFDVIKCPFFSKAQLSFASKRRSSRILNLNGVSSRYRAYLFIP
jgi:hypothetical protein